MGSASKNRKKERKKGEREIEQKQAKQTSAALRLVTGRRGADCAGVHRGEARGALEAHSAAGRVGFFGKKRTKKKKRKERERERRRRRDKIESGTALGREEPPYQTIGFLFTKSTSGGHISKYSQPFQAVLSQ